jgi:hypothetical protein
MPPAAKPARSCGHRAPNCHSPATHLAGGCRILRTPRPSSRCARRRTPMRLLSVPLFCGSQLRAVTCPQDRPFPPDRPAGVRVGKMHTQEIVVGSAFLRLPVGGAVTHRQNRPAGPDRRAGVRSMALRIDSFSPTSSALARPFKGPQKGVAVTTRVNPKLSWILAGQKSG